MPSLKVINLFAYIYTYKYIVFENGMTQTIYLEMKALNATSFTIMSLPLDGHIWLHIPIYKSC